MATSVVSISGRLSSSPALIVAECSKIIDHRSSSCGGLGFITERPALERLTGMSCTSRFSSRGATVFATKQKLRSAILTMDDNDEDDDDDIGDDEATEFADMEEWMRNKPSGFGLEQYDTSLEDRLLAEVEAEKKPSKKKAKNPPKTTEKEDAPPQGVEVYVGNLPRKRNVDRDLRAAFRSAQGLLHIRPIADGNEKTREPMCKGLAFLIFASDREAKSFIQRYNGEDVKFGNSEKKVVCELAAVNSPFKKYVPQKQGTGSPRLHVRDTIPSSPSARASPSSHVAVELGDNKDFSAIESNLSDRTSILNSDNLRGHDEDVDSLEVSEDDLVKVEQEIWAELEDEDDFELDRELEADNDEENLIVSLNVENVRGPDAQNDVSQDRQELGPIDIHASDPIDLRKTENDLPIEDEVEETSTHKAGSNRGRGFGSTSNRTPDAVGYKDKRIQELESKLEELQVQLEKRQTKAKVREGNPNSEEKLEAIEKRLLARANKLEKDSKTSTAKRVTGSKKQSKEKCLSKGTLSRPKLGGASRLKNKEKQLYTGVLSKYSPVE